MSAAVQPMQRGRDLGSMPSNCDCRRWADSLPGWPKQAVKEKQSHLSYLEALLEGEIEERGRKAMARRIQEARFPAVKTLEEFDFQCASAYSGGAAAESE